MQPCVLIVDDEELIRWALRDALHRAGLRVLEASDGESALSLLDTTRDPVDLVLLDLKLPGMNGVSVLQSLRASGRSCKVILMSALGTEADVREAGKLEAAEFVSKPFKIDEVVSLVRRALMVND
ncbi:MAG: response regulator [Planctomycetes bacterium]|nr:response regulator [Planctomycetota bacterium]MBI3845202.1 response regulator [Planctomycetota bacterium]